MITKGNESGLVTEIGKKEARKMYNNIANDANALIKLNATENRKKILPIFKQLQEIFMVPKTDIKQPDTTDMPDLGSEKSSEQRGQILKLLTLNQMLSRLPISLAQLKAGNNSENLKMK